MSDTEPQTKTRRELLKTVAASLGGLATGVLLTRPIKQSQENTDLPTKEEIEKLERYYSERIHTLEEQIRSTSENRELPKKLTFSFLVSEASKNITRKPVATIDRDILSLPIISTIRDSLPDSTQLVIRNEETQSEVVIFPAHKVIDSPNSQNA